MSGAIETKLQSIAGAWVAGDGDTRVTVLNPATAQPLAEFQAISGAQLQQALAATERGFADWRARTALERCAILRRGAELLRARGGDVARLLTREQGKTLVEAGREIENAAQMIEWHAEEGRRLYGQTIPTRYPGARFHTQREPIGPVAALTPWNFPVMLSAIKASAALAAGCSVVLKPAEETPLAVAQLVRCLHEAGVPGEALQMVLGVPAEISAALIDAPQIHKLSFTGSTPVGRLLAARAGDRLKPITLELGGHAPVVVCEDADLPATVAALAQIKLRNAGQICANPSRFFVHRRHYGAFVDAFRQVAESTVVGPGEDPATTMGPVISARRQHAVQELVQDATRRGARLVCGGRACDSAGGEAGFFHLPTVLADVPLDARVMQEEPFGPLVPVVPFDDLDEALALANSLPVGLAAFGFTQSLASARRLSEGLRAGAVGINAVQLMQPETPFGGVIDSGHGRENGSVGIEAYTSLRTVVMG
ncbi:NAD-dependent succinate-semialdehyde dehydrogenase [Ottowia sp.]|uniref:NAD-dependent succinate-semialdehyde dehydrogenase n=1 Tax=Ottowia sp. TaxID=1898956 RepID=UPI0039E68ABD